MKTGKSYISIINTSKDLFWKHGIRRVTVEEICKEADLSKMTFYRLFENKDDVAQKVLIDVAEKSRGQYREIMNSDESFPEKIRRVIALKHAGATDISSEFINDIYQRNESHLKEVLEKYQKQGYQEMINDFKKAQKEGWIRKDLKMEFILQILDLLNKKMEDNSFLSMYSNSHDAIMELTNFFFYGILTHKSAGDD